MLAVLCSLWPGRGVCRRLGWCHPLCAQRQRWMCSGFGMCRCGWVIGHCERPRVKILRWEWDAFICAQGPSSPPSSCPSVPLLLSFTLSLSLKLPVSIFSPCPLINLDTHFQPPCSFAFSPAPFVFLCLPFSHSSDRKVSPFQLSSSYSFIFHLLLYK